MSDIVSFSPVRALDRDGVPVSGALAYFYQSGTTTPQIVYSDVAGTVPHPVPLEADSRGVFPPVFSSVALRCTVTDASGTTLPGFPIDPVARIPTGSGASEVTFEPTGDIPETNVQAAIERVQLNLVAPLLAGGIGVTGNADVLANIDATNIASGAYRFDNTTTGTFPSGVTAAGGGTVRLWRETASEAVMELNARGSAVVWVRTLTGSVWGAWSFGIAGSSEAIAGTSSTALMTPLAVRQAFNAANAPPVYGVRAWGNFDGSAISTRAAGNLSFARTATGEFSFTMTTPMPDANYSVSIASGLLGGAGGGAPSYAVSITSASSFSVTFRRSDTNAAGNPTELFVQVVR